MRLHALVITGGAILLAGCTVSSQSGGVPSPDYTAAPAGYYTAAPAGYYAARPTYQANTYAPAAPPLYSPEGMPSDANQGPSGSH